VQQVHGPIIRLVIFVGVCFASCPLTHADETAETKDALDLSVREDPARVLDVSYRVTIDGKLSTLPGGAASELDLSSEGHFAFLQRQFESPHPGASGFRALRRFRDARSDTVVNKDFRTQVQLPRAHRQMHVYGAEGAMIHLSPTVRLTRKHVDLLQLPCDPIAVNALLPSRALSDTSEKWNADAWVVPLLIGLEGVVSQEVTCAVSSVESDQVIVTFSGKAEGAVSGAAVKATLNGELTLDRKDALVRKFSATMIQERTPGVVSPGLNVSVKVDWTQEVSAAGSDLPDMMPMEPPSESRLLLTLVTPWDVSLLHDRSWHLFHETSDQLMLRRLVNGALVGQCNISPARTLAKGEFTPNADYRNEVSATHQSRGGELGESKVSRNENGWRIHHVPVTSRTKPPEGSELKPETVIWDHYLCTSDSGQQFQLIFTHTESDSDAFASAADELIETLVIRQSQPKLRLPR